MGYLKDFLSGKTKRKIEKTKGQVRNVRALSKFKRGGSLNVAERHGAKKAATRLGDSMGAYPVRSKRK